MKGHKCEVKVRVAQMQENYATFTKELQWRSLWSVFTLVLRISVSFMLTTEEILFLWDCRLRGGNGVWYPAQEYFRTYSGWVRDCSANLLIFVLFFFKKRWMTCCRACTLKHHLKTTFCMYSGYLHVNICINFCTTV